MLHIHELRAPGGRSLRVYDTAPSGGRSGTVVWHHGTPNLGPPPEPLLERSAELGLRWIGYDRAGYGGSERLPGRDIAQAARDVAWIAEKLDISNLAVMGHSGGGPHALACAALLPQIRAAVSISGLLLTVERGWTTSLECTPVAAPSWRQPRRRKPPWPGF
ncbi:alpha/beta fold hydrolase [Deinococcus radiophilus]|uniref:alpha/beta fold hydrolase n=1 Tax=Deinococcus radiophilus TaxID=32062 RepID=UPI001B87F736|nr:alpha/beta fold hydrolase [Deinococcus radiophilus]UFA50882.1 alpha/beta hydrolase [Deinococcus radiophilus]